MELKGRGKSKTDHENNLFLAEAQEQNCMYELQMGLHFTYIG
jgi:hypothetical protein